MDDDIEREFRAFTAGQLGWDEKSVGVWLAEAADTLRRLPGGIKKSRLSYWPDVVRSSIYDLDYGSGKPRLAAPTPQAIDRMDTVLVWLLACETEGRRLAWARACNIPWRRLEDIDGRSHVTLRKIVNQAYSDILTLLRTGKKPDPRPTGGRRRKK